MLLSIIFPVYNERKTIHRVLSEWSEQLQRFSLSYVFVICEDGSTDGTSEYLRSLTSQYPIELHQSNRRLGYGPAVISGIRSAKSTWILCVDSDGQCDPKDFVRFWQLRHSADVLYGYRKKRADVWSRKLYSKLFKLALIILFGRAIRDPSCPYVLFQKRVIVPYIAYLSHLKEGFWWGFTGMCFKKSLTIFEIPVDHHVRYDGKTQIYSWGHIPSIAYRNLRGLVQLRIAS